MGREVETPTQELVNGVNNINTLPFDNIPYENINSMGKQWIRNYALALCKEMLGQIRGKFQTVPIPGESVTLNYSSLLSEAQKEKEDLRQKLTDMLKEIEYPELSQRKNKRRLRQQKKPFVAHHYLSS